MGGGGGGVGLCGPKLWPYSSIHPIGAIYLAVANYVVLLLNVVSTQSWHGRSRLAPFHDNDDNNNNNNTNNDNNNDITHAQLL